MNNISCHVSCIKRFLRTITCYCTISLQLVLKTFLKFRFNLIIENLKIVPNLIILI